MGADGGCKITKIENLKKHWQEVRQNIISAFENALKYNKDSWEQSFIEKDVSNARNLPENIDKYTSKEIIDMFKFAKSCDCPYLYEDNLLITGQGDYVNDTMNTISKVLPGDYIETWT